MRKIFYLLVVFFGFCSITKAQIINIPDANFKAILLSANASSNTIATNSSHFAITIDTNGDGEIQQSEALQVYQLRIIEANISDLTGIEYFTNLANLNCSYNQLTSLGGVTTLPNLTALYCNNNQFTTLDVSGITTLQQLACNDNSITSLTLNNNLIYLNSSKNPLGTLDVSALTDLEVLLCVQNLLPNLDVTNLTNLHTLDCRSNSLTSLNVSTLTNLVRLSISANPINTIDLNALLNLKYLSCSRNGLTSLSVNFLTNLIELECDNNEITSLEVSALTNLEKLQIQENPLTVIDLTGLSNLKFLSCHYNPFTTLNISSLVNLENLTYGNEGLESIDVGNQVNLKTLTAYELTQLPVNMENLQNLSDLVILKSEIPQLEISYLSSLKGFGSIDNQMLTYVNLKNGNDFTNSGISFSNNPNLMFVCVNDNDINNVYSLGTNNGDFHVNSYCSFEPGGNFNTITGSVLFNCEENETTVYTKVTIYDGTEEGRGISFTDQNGEYKFFTQSGTYIITPDIENPSFFNLTPPISAAIFPDNNNNEEVLNFCITPNGIKNDLEVVIAPLIPARPGFEATYKIVYRNKGNQVLSQDYGLNFFYNQHLMNFVSASITPETQGAGGMSWNYQNLMPFESREITVTMSINPPTNQEYPVNIDDVLNFTSVILPQLGDENVDDNTFIFNQTVVGSYDPNDITCIEGEVVSPSLIGKELHYAIRFENTGNFYAENVVVTMEIDTEKYAVSSLKVLNSSHNLRALVKGNKVEFIFNQIYLDSGGHGNILLAMRTINSLSEGDSVQSKADIYFDYNFPIITNDAVTVFEAQMSTNNPDLEQSISIYPNPSSDFVNITSKVEINSVEWYDMAGRLIKINLVNDFETTQSLSNQQSGVYFVKIHTVQGVIVNKVVKE